MCVHSSGRQGASAHQPASVPVGEALRIAADGKQLREEMVAFCAKLSVTLDWAAFDDDELRGINLDIVQAMGVDPPVAARVVAKLRGLMERRPLA